MCVIRGVTTQNRDQVITCVSFTAAAAAELANITYRQLDHWARQGWVTPSIDSGQGRAGRRQYAPRDVLHLDLLRHLAMSRVRADAVAPLVTTVGLPNPD